MTYDQDASPAIFHPQNSCADTQEWRTLAWHVGRLRRSTLPRPSSETAAIHEIAESGCLYRYFPVPIQRTNWGVRRHTGPTCRSSKGDTSASTEMSVLSDASTLRLPHEGGHLGLRVHRSLVRASQVQRAWTWNGSAPDRRTGTAGTPGWCDPVREAEQWSARRDQGERTTLVRAT